MVQFAVPINTLANGFAGTPAAGASNHLNVDEGVDTPDDNTSYAYATAGVKVWQGLCTVLSAPVPGDVRWRVRMRDRGPWTPPVAIQSNWLVQMGSAVDGIVGQRAASPPLSGAWVTYEYTLTTAERANLTNYSLLALRIVLQNTSAAQSRWTAADIILPDPSPFSPTWWGNWARL